MSYLGYFFPVFIPGPISATIWFPISGRRPETYFLAGRLDRNPWCPPPNNRVRKKGSFGKGVFSEKPIF